MGLFNGALFDEDYMYPEIPWGNKPLPTSDFKAPDL
jgi:hypothetical protein